MAGKEKEEAETTCIRLSSTTNTSALFSGQMYLDINRMWIRVKIGSN